MDIVSFGVLIMDMFPAETGKRLVEVSAYKPTPGGACANVAVAAARLGAQSAFIGKVGDDIFGHHLAQVVGHEGVNIQGVRYDRNVRTTMNFHAKPDKNTIEYLFYRNPGADTTITKEELDRGLLASAKAFHFDSLCLTDEPCRSATFEAVKIAHEAGALISFDINYRPVLWYSPEAALKAFHEAIVLADILKLNEDELMLISGENTASYNEKVIELAVKALVQEGPRLCVVTLGPKGSYVASKTGGMFIPTIDVEVVDAIGCGDAFIAGLLTRITLGGKSLDAISEDELKQHVVYADTVAALTATKYGALPAMPMAAEVDVLYAKRRNVV